jgi:RsiW-degrading membrane proteinase PrsW (M82 family)
MDAQAVSIPTAPEARNDLFPKLLTLALRPDHVGLGRSALVVLFTAFVGVAVVLILQQLPLLSTLYASTESSAWPPRLIGFVFGVGPVEETAKALPILWLILHRRAAYRPLTAAYIGLLSGLGFGVAEAVHYSYLYASALGTPGFGLGAYLSTELLRLISLPLLHGCWTGIVGYFVGMAGQQRTSARALVIIGLGLSATLHGAYDTFSDGWSGIVLGAASLLVFVVYMRIGDERGKMVVLVD